MSSRLNPSVVCVRSLVPNEKKSASRAISSAIRQARGSSIIVPIFASSTPVSAATRSMSSRISDSSRSYATSGTITSTRAPGTLAAAASTARTCIS